MTLNEAYQLTLDKIEELKKDGIEVEIKPSVSSTDQEIIDEYKNKPGTIPADKWVHVGFKVKGKEQLDKKVFNAQSEISRIGISFDTGFAFGPQIRDWELD